MLLWQTSRCDIPPVLSFLKGKGWFGLSWLFVPHHLEALAVTKHLHYVHSALTSSRQRVFLFSNKNAEQEGSICLDRSYWTCKICTELMRFSFLALSHKVGGFLSLKWTSACWPVDLQIVHQTPAFRPAMANPGMKRRGNLNKGPYCVYQQSAGYSKSTCASLGKKAESDV